MSPARDAVAEAVSEVFEVATFRALEPDPTAEAHGARVEAVVTFGGDRPGRLRLWVERADAAPLARCFLGLDEGETVAEDEVRDTIGELANMVCGGVLRRLNPVDTVDLEPPAVEAVATVDACEPVYLRSEEGRVACALEWAE